MDKTIEKFVRSEDSIEERVKAFIEAAFESLDIDVIMQAPQQELEMFGEKLAGQVFQKFSTEAILEGVKFADAVKKLKTDVNIEVPKEQTGKQGEVPV